MTRLTLFFDEADRNYIQQLHNEIEKRNKTVVSHMNSIGEEDNCYPEVESQLKNTQLAIFVFSPNFFATKNKWLWAKLNGLMNKEINNGATLILPIQLNLKPGAMCDILPILADKHSIEITTENYQIEFTVNQLERVLKRLGD